MPHTDFQNCCPRLPVVFAGHMEHGNFPLVGHIFRDTKPCGLSGLRRGNFPAFEARRFEPDFNFLADGAHGVLVSRAIRKASGKFRHCGDKCPIRFAPADLDAISQC